LIIIDIKLSANFAFVKKAILILLIAFIMFFCSSNFATAQCAICSRTAQQMGEKPALGLNSGILYLMAAPFLIVGFIGFRWWRANGKDW
jgi:hypothetical protein